MGRPRDSRVDDALRDAVLELLVELGYAGLTMDAVAARAGVGKAAIYRRHRSKAELVYVSLFGDETQVTLPDTGTLRGDLVSSLSELIGPLSSPACAAAAAGLIADLESDPELSARYRGTFLAADVAVIKTILQRAYERGELKKRHDPALIHAMLLGTAFAWLFMLKEPVSRALPRKIADLVLAGLA